MCTKQPELQLANNHFFISLTEKVGCVHSRLFQFNENATSIRLKKENEDEQRKV